MKPFFARLTHLNRRSKALLVVAGPLLIIAFVMVAYLTNPCVRAIAGTTVRSLLYGATRSTEDCDTCCGNCAQDPEIFRCFSACDDLLSCNCEIP